MAYRQPAFHPEDMHIRIYGEDLELAGITYRSEPHDGKIDIYISMPGYDALSRRPDEGVYLLLDHLLGEHNVETKIAGIELEGAPREGEPGNAVKPIIKLRDELGVSP